MRILAFSDIHGNDLALEKFLGLLPSLSFDRIVFLGDIFGYYYKQEQCFQVLQNIPDLIWLKGNHDEYAVDSYFGRRAPSQLILAYGHSYDKLNERFHKADMEFISARPLSCVLECDGHKIGLFHGRPADPLEGRVYCDTELAEKEFSAYDTVILGHTHCKINRAIGKTRLLSPGSLGQPRDGKGYGFMIFDSYTGNCDFINVAVDNLYLKTEIDKRDKNLQKLYDVLERENHN